MKFFLSLFLLAIFFFAGFQAYTLFIQRQQAQERLETALEKQHALEEENRTIVRDIGFYKDDKNAAKESVSQFNYKYPDEELYILVPNSR